MNFVGVEELRYRFCLDMMIFVFLISFLIWILKLVASSQGKTKNVFCRS